MIEIEEVPELRSPILIAAFEGWNDAADAASAVIDHLMRVWRARVVAAIDPEVNAAQTTMVANCRQSKRYR